MPKVLVIGATGYIGRALALALVRSGTCTVWGLARTPAKAKELAAMEITPVAGSATDTEAWSALLRDAHIDVVVDAAGADQDGANIVAVVREAGEQRLAHAAALGIANPPRLGYVYTSGQWVHGTTRPGRFVNDLDPVGVEGADMPPRMVAWRTSLERTVLGAGDVLDVAVVRPSLVYGGSSWIFDTYFEKLQKGETVLKGDEHARIGMVHVDDAGAALEAVVHNLPSFRGTGVWPVFDVVGTVENLGTLLREAAKALGVKGKVEFEAPGDHLYAEAMSTAAMTNSGRAKTLLGWQPRRVGMLAEMEIYVAAWKAHRS